MIRVLIADDQLLFRSMLKEMLTKDSEIEIVASCANGEEAVTECLNHKPDIALLDIEMPYKGGIEALSEIKGIIPNTKVVILTTFEENENIKSAISLGADGYLIKEMTPNALILAVKSIYNNMFILHSGALETLQDALLFSQKSKDQKLEIDDMVFDATDIGIMKLIVKGKSNKDIASALNYSEGTIKNKVSRILSVTGLSDRTEISVFSINNGII
jgi:DNA-binding NarL/FixJ family response regulator